MQLIARGARRPPGSQHPTTVKCDDGAVRRQTDQLLLGEWACLGILYGGPNHGFAVAAHLKPDGEIGRVWSLSRALTYRSIDKLLERGYVRRVGEEPGIAGGNRTILAATRSGRAELRRWLATPVSHLRDLRSELLLKLIIADRCGIDMAQMLAEQHRHIASLAETIVTELTAAPDDVVAMWRAEASNAALRFLDRLTAATT